MKAMILAAGRGSRMGELTQTTPKPLLKVGPHSLIEHNILKLKAAGIQDIIINVYHLADQIIQTLGDGSRYGVNLSYSDERCFDQPIETAGGIIHALPLLGSDPFILINADVWTDYPLEKLPKLNSQQTHLVLAPNPSHHPEGDFGLNNGLLSLEHTPKYTYTGIALFSPRLFASFKPGPRRLLEVLNYGIERQLISGELYQGEWVSVDTQERLQILNQALKSKVDYRSTQASTE